MILDIHTHRMPPQADAVTGIRLKEDGSDRAAEIIGAAPDRLFSVGLHPWDAALPATAEDSLFARMEELLALPNVVAVGECGVDLNRASAPLYRQMQLFRRQTDLAEKMRRPVIIHDVRAHDVLVGMRRDLKPAQPWAIHGFRLKASVAEMMLRAGFWLSFGAVFNPDALRIVPRDRILAETDDAPLSIGDVIARIASASSAGSPEMTGIVAENTARFLNI